MVEITDLTNSLGLPDLKEHPEVLDNGAYIAFMVFLNVLGEINMSVVVNSLGICEEEFGEWLLDKQRTAKDVMKVFDAAFDDLFERKPSYVEQRAKELENSIATLEAAEFLHAAEGDDD